MSPVNSNSLIDLGNLTKPADTLVKKVSNAVGGLFAPRQVKRMAKAEAAAELIKAQSEIEITDLQRRAARRWFEEEAQRQKNMEDITNKALPHLNEKANPDSMENDWLVNFFDKSRIVSDDEMQSLWSRVLAGEANSPGSYSKRTVNFLSDLDKVDADLFTKLCGFGWIIEDFIPLVFDENAEIYKNHGVDFEALSHLESIGLIQYNSITGFRWSNCPNSYTASYYNNRLILELPGETNNELNVGIVLLTKVGHELVPVCGSKPVDGFLDYVKNQWKQYLPKSEIG